MSIFVILGAAATLCGLGLLLFVGGLARTSAAREDAARLAWHRELEHPGDSPPAGSTARRKVPRPRGECTPG